MEPLPPEAELIAAARATARLSMREAARRAGISDATWRNVETKPDAARPARTVARMASVLSVTPAGLEDAGRRDAAGELRQLMAGTAARVDIPGGDGDAGWVPLMTELLAGLAAIDTEPGLTASARRELRREYLDDLRAQAQASRRRLQNLRRITGSEDG